MTYRAALLALRERESAPAEVDSVELDLLWVDRLATIIEALRRLVEVLIVMLALGILLIVGNTIRLGIERQREEIAITRLFGATDAFIRRPHLYIGLWHGLIAGGVACLLAAAATRLAAGPIERLVGLYSRDFELVGLEPWSAGMSIRARGGCSGGCVDRGVAGACGRENSCVSGRANPVECRQPEERLCRHCPPAFQLRNWGNLAEQIRLDISTCRILSANTRLIGFLEGYRHREVALSRRISCAYLLTYRVHDTALTKAVFRTAGCRSYTRIMTSPNRPGPLGTE